MRWTAALLAAWIVGGGTVAAQGTAEGDPPNETSAADGQAGALDGEGPEGASPDEDASSDEGASPAQVESEESDVVRPPPQPESEGSDPGEQDILAESPELTADVPSPSDPLEAEAEPEDSSGGLASFLDDHVQLHGFGNYTFGITDGHEYIEAREGGNFANANFNFRQVIAPMPGITLFAGEYFELREDGLKVELDVLFGEWRPANGDFAIRLGRMPFAIGLYTPVFDVGTLRLFPSLPQSLYGSQLALFKRFNGLELAYDLRTDSGWGLRLTGFVGGARREYTDSFGTALNIILLGGTDAAQAEVFDVQLMSGGALTLTTPLPGLLVHSGFYATPGQFNSGAGVAYTAVAGVQYLSERIEARAEGRFFRLKERFDSYAGYLELGYRPIPEVQLVGRTEYFRNVASTDFDQTPTGRALDPLGRHQAYGVGLNWWFSQDLVFKLAYQFVQGNRFAAPSDEDLVEIYSCDFPQPQCRAFDRNTHAVEVGTSFSF